MDESGHRPRHRAADQDEIATTMIPRVVADEPTTVMRRPTPPADEPTTVMRLPPPPAEDATAVMRLPPRPAEDATSIIPAIPAAPASSTTPPTLSTSPTQPADDATTIIPAMPPDPAKAGGSTGSGSTGSGSTGSGSTADDPKPGDDGAGPSADGSPEETAGAEETERHDGVKIIKLRPVRTEEGYRSVFYEHTRPTFGSVVRTVSRGAGEVLITFGLIILLFAGYEVWGKSAIVGAHQNDLSRQFAEDSADQVGLAPSAPPDASPTPGVKPPNGKVIGVIHIPRLHKKWAVVQGVTPADIRYAPGHYPNTAMPGEYGNFSLAGHRTPAIWWDLDKLKPATTSSQGDAIIVKTADTWYVYRVVRIHIVLPTAVEVVAPVPNQPGVRPDKRMLTLTTCNPKFNNYQRLVVHAEFEYSSPLTQGDPPELGG